MPVLLSIAGSAVRSGDAAGNETLTKERSMGRIDGAVATVMAVGRIKADCDGPFVSDDAGARLSGMIVV